MNNLFLNAQQVGIIYFYIKTIFMLFSNTKSSLIIISFLFFVLKTNAQNPSTLFQNWVTAQTNNTTPTLPTFSYADSLPKFILIDIQGNIVNYDAPRPPEERLNTLFNSLDI